MPYHSNFIKPKFFKEKDEDFLLQSAAKAQQFVEKPPLFDFVKRAKNPARRFVAEIVQGILNQPAQSIQAGGRIGRDIREGTTTPTRFIGNVAEAAMLPLMLAGG